jgi:hypothetical protein
VFLPPTSPELHDPQARPYFLWWLDCTVAEFHRRLDDPDAATRGYFLGALLREANSRDVWLFTTPARARADWVHVLPHLGRERARWTWLLGMPATPWPPPLPRA